MKLRVMSDLHLEFGPLELPKLANEDQMSLLLAGDIGVVSKQYTFLDFIEEMSDRHKHVFWIAGNHEHYRGNFPETVVKMQVATIDLPNVHVLDRDMHDLGDAVIIGATLWTNFNNLNQLSIMRARQQMNDFRIIRTGPAFEPWRKRFHPEDAIDQHMLDGAFIFDAIKYVRDKRKKVIVVSHHAPSFKSVHPNYERSDNGAYASNLEDDIMVTQPDLWVHGHMHNNADYLIDETRVVCNPRGYAPHDLNKDFDPNMVIEL